MTSKERVACKAKGKHRGKQSDVEVEDNNNDRTRDEQGNANKEGGNTEQILGRIKIQQDQAHFGNFKEQSGRSFSFPTKYKPENRE